MSNLAFDTLRYANKLKAVGVPEKQAEVQAETMAEFVVGNLATKDDLNRGLKELESNTKEDTANLKVDIAALDIKITSVKSELKEDTANLKGELKEDIANLKGELKEDIANLKGDIQRSMNRFLLAIVTIVFGAPAAAIAIMKLLKL